MDLEEGDRVFVIETTSDDWYVSIYVCCVVVLFTYVACRWTGEIDGRRGLIPAAYVKSL